MLTDVGGAAPPGGAFGGGAVSFHFPCADWASWLVLLTEKTPPQWFSTVVV